VSAPAIEFTGVSRWFGDTVALADVSFTADGGVIGLLGHNGAGKSTTLKLSAGFSTPSSGVVRIFGVDPRRTPAVFRRVGIVPDHSPPWPFLSARRVVELSARLHRVDDLRAAAAAAIETVGLEAAADRPVGEFSHGMRQRVKLAQAIVHDPQLLILDEPLSGMDPIMRRRTIRLIKDWGRAGKSVIVSSHILHEIESMTSNILLINNGRILAEGDIHQIRDLIDEHPHTIYVRAQDPRRLARQFLDRPDDDVRSMKFEPGAVVVETGKPDLFYARVTEMAASGEFGSIDEVTSPDDNLQAVFQYLVK
jgi:ABC-2 type transport system ATP-binding protein